jgi:O-methyltransferase involved in polyketide biosynthesis
VAVERAVLTDLGALDDPLAAHLLDRDMARILWGVRHLVPSSLRRRSVTLAGLTARVRWHDEQVLAALEDGIDQVVIVGAGYDSRAWRFARPASGSSRSTIPPRRRTRRPVRRRRVPPSCPWTSGTMR